MRSVTFAIVVASFPLSAAAQQLTATELSLGGTTVLAHHTFVGGELGIARRPSTDARIALAVAAGSEDGETAGRAQVTLQMLINELARNGVGLCAGLGAAGSARRGSPGRGWLVVLLGLEGSPGRRSGWYIELGAAGGVRLAAGWRLRAFPIWWGGR